MKLVNSKNFSNLSNLNYPNVLDLKGNEEESLFKSVNQLSVPMDFNINGINTGNDFYSLLMQYLWSLFGNPGQVNPNIPLTQQKVKNNYNAPLPEEIYDQKAKINENLVNAAVKEGKGLGDQKGAGDKDGKDASVVVPTPGMIDAAVKGAWGDPHFNFRDKTGKSVTIDHKGTDGETYNILNTDGLDIDAEYKRYTDPKNPQVMGAVRINAGDQQLIFHDGKTYLDGIENKAGTQQVVLKDGRTVEFLEDGGANIRTLNQQGVVNIEYTKGYYNVDPEGQIAIDDTKNSGGVLGFLTQQGYNNSKDEILAQNDTNKNGRLDDSDTGVTQKFKAEKDIGLFTY